MANNVQHLLNVLEVDEREAKDVLRAVLHTIILTRALGKIEPEELELDTLPGFTVAWCGIQDVKESVEEGIDKFTRSLVLVGPELWRGELVLSFCEKRKKPGFLNLTAGSEEKIVWEKWFIPVILNRGTQSTPSSTLEPTVRSTLLRVLQLANSIVHIPKLKGEGEETSAVFKYEFSIAQTPKGKADRGFLNNLLVNRPQLNVPKFNI